MCQDQHSPAIEQAASQPRAPDRRTFLKASGLAVGGMALGTALPEYAHAATTVDGTAARSMAMHVHSSFSEQTASMEAQLLQAQVNALDVIWWTDHDHRMQAYEYKQAIHFTSLTNEVSGASKPWLWQQRTSGPLAVDGPVGIDAASSPGDPVAGGSLRVAARSTTGAAATLGYFAQTQQSGWNERSNLYGQVLTIDVLADSVGADGYLELLIGSSYRPAREGRAGGNYRLSYRFGGRGTPGSREVSGLLGIITVEVVAGQWTTASLVPSDDIAALWPDLEERDFSCNAITLNAVSEGLAVNGGFDYLRFDRPYATGNLPIQLQRSISEAFASSFPTVAPRQGLEISLFQPHLNWFGGDVQLPNYAGITTTAEYVPFLQQQVQEVHRRGGLVSYNHPFGISKSSQVDQDTRTADAARTLLSNRALGADILEVGYVRSAGVDLAHHAALWDVLSRNAVFLTANGVNDDHFGLDWITRSNNFVTWVWSASTDEADLLAALSAGRGWTASLRWRGSVDLRVDGSVPMGGVSVSSVTSRQLEVLMTGMQSGATVSVLRGDVDYAGTAAPTSNASTISTLARFTGSVSVTVDTSTSCFVRAVVRNSRGVVVGLSNPIWLLREAPPSGVPAARAA